MKKSSGGGKFATSRPLKGPGSEPEMSAMIGGVGNSVRKLSAAKKNKGNYAGHFNRGGAVRK